MKEEKRVEEKKQELLEIAKNIIAPYFSNSEQASIEIIDHFCEITPPEIVDEKYFLTNIKPGGIGGAKSSKPGNILLNWRKLLINGSESILTIAGVIAVPWLIPLAGLIIWDKICSLSNIKIDERHAAVIWTMWHNRDKENCIKKSEVLDLVNKDLSKYNHPKMNEEELNDILKDLEAMETIESTEENKWWLREWVKVPYE